MTSAIVIYSLGRRREQVVLLYSLVEIASRETTSRFIVHKSTYIKGYARVYQLHIHWIIKQFALRCHGNTDASQEDLQRVTLAARRYFSEHLKNCPGENDEITCDKDSEGGEKPANGWRRERVAIVTKLEQ